MDDTVNFQISIPADPDGFILLQCSLCGEYFKLTSSDIEDDSQIQIWCPNCGLVSENYLTDEVIELGMRTLKNHAADIINNAMKDLEKSLKGKHIKFEKSKALEKEPTDPLQSKVENLDVFNFECCHKSAKISPSLSFSGCYCPFCGEANDGN